MGAFYYAYRRNRDGIQRYLINAENRFSDARQFAEPVTGNAEKVG
jgi:hypothetical protein